MSPRPRPTLPRRRPVKDDGFIGLVGPIYRREHGERWQFGFRAEAKHANLRHVVQGGMLMTFADRGLGRNAWKAAGDKPHHLRRSPVDARQHAQA